jgi:Flp pilus assembly protein TadG
MKARYSPKSRRGVAAVEFALVAPLFFMFVFGIIEYGRMVMVQQVMTNAAREGARIAIVPGTATATVQSQVATYLTNGAVISSASVLNSGTGKPSMTVSPDPPSGAASGSLVTVTVTVPFTSVSWLPTPIYLGATTMTATCTMRTEN